jgi:hypothetical protein
LVLVALDPQLQSFPPPLPPRQEPRSATRGVGIHPPILPSKTRPPQARSHSVDSAKWTGATLKRLARPTHHD